MTYDGGRSSHRYEVDYRLAQITRQRLTDNGVGCDLVCCGSPPLHTVPLFTYAHPDAPALAAEARAFRCPHWMLISFTDPPPPPHLPACRITPAPPNRNPGGVLLPFGVPPLPHNFPGLERRPELLAGVAGEPADTAAAAPNLPDSSLSPPAAASAAAVLAAAAETSESGATLAASAGADAAAAAAAGEALGSPAVLKSAEPARHVGEVGDVGDVGEVWLG